MRAEEVLALVRAHFEGDHVHFRRVVLMMAANAPQESRVARDLRALAERAPAGTPPRLVELPPQVQGLLVHAGTSVRLEDMVLEPRTEALLSRVLLEHASAEKLTSHGLVPARKLLFVGPPGVGKTMGASAIANGLALPLLRVQLHGVIASHLGETAAHLARLFQQVAALPAVYLFDEFDALGVDRGSGDGSSANGEMRRVVNSLLQLIEDDRSSSVIIAATNHVGLVDRALLRRFDACVDFPLPSLALAERLVRGELLYSSGIEWTAIRRALVGRGHADVVAACRQANKTAVLEDRGAISTEVLVEALVARGCGRMEVTS